MNFFESVSLAPPDPILGLTREFLEDPRPNKVNLGVGVYRDEQLNTPILDVVKQVEKRCQEAQTHKAYLPIEGDARFIEQVGLLVGGKAWSFGCRGFQTPGGTAALCVGGDFLKKQGYSKVVISTPSWSNYQGIFQALGWEVEGYPYYNFQRHCIDFEFLIQFLVKQLPKTVVILQASCHNPTGIDMTAAEWEKVASICQEKGLLPFFDCAYQGLGRGIVEDVEPIRLFANRSMEMLVAVSQSKNFSMYGERVGALLVFAASASQAERVASRVKQSIRTHYSNPPMHGAQIVGAILSEPRWYEAWENELQGMRRRIMGIREQLAEALLEKGQHLKKSVGMFGFTGLSPAAVEVLKRDFGVYMTRDGRMNICGLNAANLPYVASAILQVSHA